MTRAPYMTAPQAAERWSCSVERVYQLLQEGRIEGAIKPGRDWLIPWGAGKPEGLKRGRKAKTI